MLKIHDPFIKDACKKPMIESRKRGMYNVEPKGVKIFYLICFTCCWIPVFIGAVLHAQRSSNAVTISQNYPANEAVLKRPSYDYCMTPYYKIDPAVTEDSF